MLNIITFITDIMPLLFGMKKHINLENAKKKKTYLQGITFFKEYKKGRKHKNVKSAKFVLVKSKTSE